MPQQVGPCICAEIPFPKDDSYPASKSSNDKSLVKEHMHERSLQCCDARFSPVLVASIGNGKESYNVQNTKRNTDTAVKNVVQLTWSV